MQLVRLSTPNARTELLYCCTLPDYFSLENCAIFLEGIFLLLFAYSRIQNSLRLSNKRVELARTANVIISGRFVL